jgi:histidine ammonia-lyase
MIKITEPADLVSRLGEIVDGAEISVSEAILEEVAANRELVLAALTSAERPVYGVNTGMGKLAGVTLTAAQQAEHQRNLLIGRAVGGAPWLSESEVRALFVIRLGDLLAPEAGASAELVRFLAARLNDRFTPAVPRAGFGSAGEIIPLAHAFQTFAGIGTVLEDGVETPAADALTRRGVEPYRLGPKEGATLIQGSPLAVMHASWNAGSGFQLLDLQTLAAAIAVDVTGAPRDMYRFDLAGKDRYLRSRHDEIHGLTAGSTPRPGVVQAPISLRVGPRVIAHADRVVGELLGAVRTFRDTPTDSPAFVGGEFVSTTGFHAVELGLRMDAVTAALVHVGEISVQRLHKLLDDRFSGLNPQLAVDPGPQAGLSPMHKRAVGELHALRRLATPATLGSLDTSAGQEDVQAFAWAAGEQLLKAVEHLFVITACELIGGSQAHYLRGLPAPRGLRKHYAWLAETVPPVIVDRPLGPDITRMVAQCRASYFDEL